GEGGEPSRFVNHKDAAGDQNAVENRSESCRPGGKLQIKTSAPQTMNQNERRSNCHSGERQGGDGGMPPHVRGYRGGAQYQADYQRDRPVDPNCGLEVPAKIIAVGRARENRERLQQQRLIEKSHQDKNAERERIGAVLRRSQPPRQQHAKQEVRSRYESIIQNRQPAFGDPGKKFSQQKL